VGNGPATTYPPSTQKANVGFDYSIAGIYGNCFQVGLDEIKLFTQALSAEKMRNHFLANQAGIESINRILPNPSETRKP
jgi:hypothetical protein